MNNNHDFWNIILGNGSAGAFMAYLVIAYFAASASLIHEAGNRDIASDNTPKKWSWEFLAAHNVLRLLANFLVIPLFIRMEYEYIDMKWMIFVDIVQGIVIDRLFMLLKNIGILTSNKFASKIKEKISKTDLQVLKP